MNTRLIAALLLCVVPLAAPASAQIVDGSTGPGSIYRLVRPANWNGRLVVYAHGAVDKSAPVALPAETDLIVGLLAPRGFAVAISSFSENGWVIKDGVQRTHQLLGLFTETFGPPTGVYVAGASMGGLVAIALAERFPDQFIGALPVCAAAGGTRAQFDYVANVRAIFDVFYAGVLPGNAGAVPPDVDTAAVAQAAALAISSNATGAGVIAGVAQTPVPFASAPELLQSIVTALVAHAGSFANLVPELHGKSYFENLGTVYTGALPQSVLDLVNASVGRFDASPSALNQMAQHYEPTGALAMPMLMLSTSRDPVVPGFHQAKYQQLATAAGNGSRLAQRTVTRYGHCNFTPDELGGAFLSLVAWVEFGVPPAP